MLLRRLATELRRFRYRYATEAELHDGIGKVLGTLGLPFEHEFTLPGGHRLDFLVDKRVAIEVKVKGSESDALIQINRYCGLADVHGVLLATTRLWDAREGSMHGKPVGVVRLLRLAF